MTSDDEYVSCEEPPVNNCRNKSRVKRNFTRHSVDFDHSISLGKMLNALSVKDYVYYEQRIRQLETENNELRTTLVEVEREKCETKVTLKEQNKQEYKNRETKMLKMRKNEHRLKKHVDDLCAKLSEMKVKLEETRDEARQLQNDRDLYKSQLDTMRSDKMRAERELWHAESTLEEEQFKRDKAELYCEQLRRELLKKSTS